MSRADGPSGTRLALPPAAKITPPRVPTGQVSRGRLLDALTAIPAETAILLSAPAGSGKTQLMAEWCCLRSGPTAWVTLDRGDNDEHRFWSAIVSGLRSCVTVPAELPLSRTGLPGTRSLDIAYVATIADALREQPGPVTLILDDVHELTDPAPLQGLGDLITYAGPHLQLVLSGRSDPALRLGRLRLEEHLLELRGPDLAFTVEEAEQLLDRAGLALSADQLRLLLDQTGGWAAGLRLAALAMRGSDPAAVLTDLVGNTHTISDFLVGEVLSGLSPVARRLLDATSICTRFTTALAQRLAADDSAGSRLAELESTNSLITSFGGGRLSFQVHPLLRAHLLMDLHRFRPELESRLHRVAADWFEEQGQYDDALQHALSSGDLAVSRGMLDRHAVRLLMTGHHALLRSAAAELPAPFLTEPRLALVLADAHLEVNDIAAARRYTEVAATAWPPTPEPTLIELWILVTGRLAVLGGQRIAPAGDLPRLDKTDGTIRADPGAEALALLARATAAAGDGRAALCRQVAEVATVHGRSTGNDYLVARGTALQALAAARSRDRAGVTKLSQRAATLVDPKVWRGTADDVLMHIFQAYAALANGLPRHCQELLGPLATQLDDEDRGRVDPLAGWVRLLVTTADHDLGNRTRALQQLARLRSEFDLTHATPGLIMEHALIEHEAASGLNHTNQAREVMVWAERALGDIVDLHLLRARSSAKISRFAAADAELHRLLDVGRPPMIEAAGIEGWVLAAGIRLRCGEPERAIEALATALTDAARVTMLRPLLRAPADVLTLLTEQLGSWGAADDTARTVLARRQTAAEPAISLTERERQVLNRLQSMRSLDEIAGDLTVSLNTVKTHVRSIYAKLGASSRREAIQAGRGAGLL